MARGFIYSIISAICLGSLAIFAKTGLAMGMAPMQIVQYRFSSEPCFFSDGSARHSHNC